LTLKKENARIGQIRGYIMKKNIFLGSIVTAIGVILLLEKMGVIPGTVWGYIWPILIIVVGLSILFRDQKA
jgi:hypothetical protein